MWPPVPNSIVDPHRILPVSGRLNVVEPVCVTLAPIGGNVVYSALFNVVTRAWCWAMTDTCPDGLPTPSIPQ